MSTSSSNSYVSYGDIKLQNKSVQNFDACLLCEIPTKPQTIALVDFESDNTNHKEDVITELINSIVSHYRTRIDYKDIKILNYSQFDKYFNLEKVKLSEYYSNGRFKMDYINDIEILELYDTTLKNTRRLTPKYRHNALRSMNILIIEDLDDKKYINNEYIKDLFANYDKYNLWIIYTTGQLDNFYYNSSIYKIFNTNSKNTQRIKDYYKYGFKYAITPFNTFYKMFTTDYVDSDLVLMLKQDSEPTNYSHSTDKKEYTHKYYYWPKNNDNTYIKSTISSLKVPKKPFDFSTDYHVELLANSEKLKSEHSTPKKKFISSSLDSSSSDSSSSDSSSLDSSSSDSSSSDSSSSPSSINKSFKSHNGFRVFPQDINLPKISTPVENDNEKSKYVKLKIGQDVRIKISY